MNENIEDTIDLQEFINYYPAVKHNLWVVESQKRDAPILSFVDAMISKDLPLVPAVGYLLERVLLPAPIYSVFLYYISDAPAVKKAGPPSFVDFHGGVIKETSMVALRSLQDLRHYWRDIRTESAPSLIQYYLFDAALNWALRSTTRLSVDVLYSSGQGVEEYLTCIESTLYEHAMVSIKMALYHLAQRHEDEAIGVIKAVRAKIAEYV